MNDNLVKHGYIPLSTVVLNTPDGGKKTYMKTVNGAGDFSFVDVTRVEPGYTVELQNDVSAHFTSGKTTIPVSTQTSAAECAVNPSCGIMFECSNGFCSVQKSNEGDLDSKSFVVSEKVTESRISPIGSPVAYPVVTLSDIVASPEDTMVNIRSSSYKIHKGAIKSSSQGLGNITLRAEEVHNSLLRLQKRYDEIHAQRLAESHLFLTYLDAYRAKLLTGSLPDEDFVAMKKTVDHLRDLNLTCVNMIALINSLQSVEKTLHDVLNRVNDAYWSLFSMVRSSFAENITPIRRVTTWGLPPHLETTLPEKLVDELLKESSKESKELLSLLS